MGPAEQAGFNTLTLSVSFFKRIYGDSVDYIICYNGLTEKQKSIISELNVEMLEQREEPFMPQPCGEAWKLYPPRLRLNSYELFIDNDLIILDRVPQIEQFFCSIRLLYTESFNQNYGRYKHYVTKDFRMNSGMIGFPPGFDLKSKIIQNSKFEEWGKYDEQGLLASIFCRENIIKVPITSIPVCGPAYPKFESGKIGYHFVGVNRGYNIHWTNFCRGTML